ncbi:hypothetical protein INP52_00930 [Thermophilibacter immobilis]|uniref:Methyltransferase type 11 domain-containing protein n=1 Tax=Thermophilibacter immobilis TaxID=2779519 RepID=A0A7S7MA22_9ACTN|nr:hypothetical protein INP52_00930 [Thermophilibacter immobilis]
MIGLARARHPDLRFVRVDATNFTLGEPVDVVFSNAMLRWIDCEKHPDALACVSAALAPRGQFVFECGGRDCCARIHGALARVFVVARGRGYEIPFWFPTVGGGVRAARRGCGPAGDACGALRSAHEAGRFGGHGGLDSPVREAPVCRRAHR